MYSQVHLRAPSGSCLVSPRGGNPGLPCSPGGETKCLLVTRQSIQDFFRIKKHESRCYVFPESRVAKHGLYRRAACRGHAGVAPPGTASRDRRARRQAAANNAGRPDLRAALTEPSPPARRPPEQRRRGCEKTSASMQTNDGRGASNLNGVLGVTGLTCFSPTREPVAAHLRIKQVSIPDDEQSGVRRPGYPEDSRCGDTSWGNLATTSVTVVRIPAT